MTRGNRVRLGLLLGLALLPARATSSEAIRGITIGPIENARHASRGYGSAAFESMCRETARAGGTWIALTPFGRVWSLDSHAIDPTFEVPIEENRAQIARAVVTAHHHGLRVLLVPHLWVETGGWRAHIEPAGAQGWSRWVASYRRFLLGWSEIAQRSQVDLLSVGVELRSWVTRPRVEDMRSIIADVRKVYTGPLTYSANWDDAAHTLLWDSVDLIGINAFYPLATRPGADARELRDGARRVADELRALAALHRKPILFTEVGYTTRDDAAFRPWEWPDGMKDVRVNEQAPAEALFSLLDAVRDEPWFHGFFLWRYYADPNDVSQEAEWGFSPRGKLAELVLRDAFSTRWASDGALDATIPLGRHRALTPGWATWEELSESRLSEPPLSPRR